MKTVQICLEEDLVVSVDRVVKKLGITRSAFTRDALRSALDKVGKEREELERKQREGDNDGCAERIGTAKTSNASNGHAAPCGRSRSALAWIILFGVVQWLRHCFRRCGTRTRCAS